jgi:hypothetical protein
MSPTTRTSTSTFGAVMAGIFFIIVPTADAAQSCDSLAAMKLPETTVTAAQSVAAGAFSPPGSGAGQSTQAQPYRALPAFCRVTATLAPSSDSDIKIEVWMPAAGWNGKFQGVGNGGFAGSIGYGLLAAAVSQGYAAVSTDTGHVGGDANFAVGHPEKVIDFGYRAIHEMTDKAKAIVAAFYGRGPERSYFSSCSNGRRLRRHHRRGAGQLLDADHPRQRLERTGDALSARQSHPGEQAPGARARDGGRLRRA